MPKLPPGVRLLVIGWVLTLLAFALECWAWPAAWRDFSWWLLGPAAGLLGLAQRACWAAVVPAVYGVAELVLGMVTLVAAVHGTHQFLLALAWLGAGGLLALVARHADVRAWLATEEAGARPRQPSAR